MPPPSAVLFDIGNVLVGWDPDRLYAGLLPDPVARQQLFDDVDLDGMNLAIDRGAPFRDTIYATADRHPDHAAPIRAWHDRWIEMFGPPIAGSWAILRALRGQGIPVFALSNFGAESFELALTHYPELDNFDRAFISGRLGVIKPEPRIYEIVEETSGLTGAELFFIDDRADNLAAATARGWRGHVFETPAGLAAALTEHGLKL